MIEIGSKKIGEGNPCFIIAEAGVNHNGRADLARKLIDVAVEAGADAVKFQTFLGGKLVSAGAPKAEYQKRTAGSESQMEMLKGLELSSEVMAKLQGYAKSRNIIYLSTPFDEVSVGLLDEIGVPAFKISSGDLTCFPLLRRIGMTHRPAILSTGMAYLGEVESALQTLRASGCPAIAILHCVSNYPAEPAGLNLRAIETMRAAFGVPIGFSDHTLGIELPSAAVALGAAIVEKHVTLDRSLPGPDHASSSEPAEFAMMVKAIRTVECALGDGIKRPATQEADVRNVARRSIVARHAIPEGTRITEDMLDFKRPGTGLAPGETRFVVGRVARRLIAADTLIDCGDLV